MVGVVITEPGPVDFPAPDRNTIPHIFVGSVTIGGNPASDGKEVSAWLSEFNGAVGTASASGGKYWLTASQYGTKSFTGKRLIFKQKVETLWDTSAWKKGGTTVLDLQIN